MLICIGKLEAAFERPTMTEKSQRGVQFCCVDYLSVGEAARRAPTTRTSRRALRPQNWIVFG
jgi:hypothetical protein